MYDKEQKGPVTEIDCILGHIISAIGQKIYVWSFINNDLVGVAFIDTQIYIHRYALWYLNFGLFALFHSFIFLLSLKTTKRLIYRLNQDIFSISVIKNFVLYADITKSISLLTFDKECKTLSVISRDYEPMEVYRCEYVVDGTNLGFMVSDSNCNLVIYSYQVCPLSVYSYFSHFLDFFRQLQCNFNINNATHCSLRRSKVKVG